MNITETLEKLSGKSLVDCSDQELYLALLELVRAKSAERDRKSTRLNSSHTT